MDWSERIIPDETEKGIISIHLKRYDFARPRCEKRWVLDLGCGVGYGSHYLSKGAGKVVAIDSDIEAIQYACRRYTRGGLDYLVADAERPPFLNSSFDVICAFEIVEHVQEPISLVRDLARLLKKNGALFISTPSVSRSSSCPDNPHHHHEWSPSDFKALLEKNFSEVEMWWQIRKETRVHRWLQRLDVFNLRGHWLPLFVARTAARLSGTVPFVDLGLADLEIQREYSKNALSQLAVCSQAKVIG